MISKQIINRVKSEDRSVNYRRKENDVQDCILLCENATSVIQRLLRYNVVGFETYDNKVYTASYRGYKQLARTPVGVIVFVDLIRNEEVELMTSDIKIIRVFN